MCLMHRLCIASRARGRGVYKDLRGFGPVTGLRPETRQVPPPLLLLQGQMSEPAVGTIRWSLSTGRGEGRQCRARRRRPDAVLWGLQDDQAVRHMNARRALSGA